MLNKKLGETVAIQDSDPPIQNHVFDWKFTSGEISLKASIISRRSREQVLCVLGAIRR